MTELFKNKYRIPSNRLRGWNYANNGHYFITIVTAGRNTLFGNIKDGEMVLNDLGLIVYEEFFRSFEIRNELFLGEFVLMPNHLHTIVILDKLHCPDVDLNMDTVETHGRSSLRLTRRCSPGTYSSFISNSSIFSAQVFASYF